MLEDFWKSATMEEVSTGEVVSPGNFITCNYQNNVAMRITEEDFYQVFKIPEENVVAPATDGELSQTSWT